MTKRKAPAASGRTCDPGCIRHKTLSAYYDDIRPLSTYLSSGPSQLLQPGDNVPYQHLIQSTLCARRTRSKGKDHDPFLGTFEVSGSQGEVVEWILSDLRQINGKSRRNVLLTGNKTKSSGKRSRQDEPSSDAPSAIIASPIWTILRSRIGNAAFRHILMQTSVYLSVGNNNSFTQLSGTPLSEHYDEAARQKFKEVEESRKVKRASQTEKRKRKSPSKTAEPKTGSSRKRQRTSSADILIQRQRIYYGRPSKHPNGSLLYGVHAHHTLNLSSGKRGSTSEDALCRVLVTSIFPEHRLVSATTSEESLSNHTSAAVSRSERLLGVAKSILKNHKSIDYGGPLGHYCHRGHDVTKEGLQPLSHTQVCRYTVSMVRNLAPLKIVGSPHNQEVISRHVRRLICAKQFEPINLHSLLVDIRINDFPWLSDTSTSTAERITPQQDVIRRGLVEQFMFWLFNDYLVPLIKNTFYVTETAATKYQTVYYSHKAWMEATKPHFERLQQTNLVEISKDEIETALAGPLGISAVRLIPKPNGFRPIVNLGRFTKQSPIITAQGKQAGTNHVLRGLHQVLTYEKSRNADSMGSALFGTNEIFPPLQQLKLDLISQYGRIPKLYFVKMDITAAFDSIKQDKMLEVVSNFLDKVNDYWLVTYCLLLPPMSSAAPNTSRRMYKTRAIVDDGYPVHFGDMAKELAKPLRNAVIIDLLRRKELSRGYCLDLLYTHIKENIWQIGNKCFRQKEGIPQGSMISSMLCTIFYSALEKEHLSPLLSSSSILFRYIDDFMYITPDFSLARRFISRMTTGFPVYGAHISPAKTLVSFEHASGSQVAPICPTGTTGHTYFPFCGFLIDTATLDIGIDTQRIIASPMEHSFANRVTRRRGAAFAGWLSRQLENRNQIAYLDTFHNHVDGVYMNIYLNFALTAMKIPHYFTTQELSPNESKVIYESICLSIEYTHAAGRIRVRQASKNNQDSVSKTRQRYTVRKLDFEYVAKSALVKVLLRKVTRFKDVLHLLQEDLSGRPYRALEDKYASLMSRGWEEIKSASY